MHGSVGSDGRAKKFFFLVYMKDAHRIRDKGKKQQNLWCDVFE